MNERDKIDNWNITDSKYAKITNCDIVNNNYIDVCLIRHAQTPSNKEGKYIGITDEPILPEAVDNIKKHKYPRVDKVYVSPLLRCRQTAGIIYPKVEVEIIDAFKETDFGEFEGKNYEMLKDNLYYQKWIDSGGTLPFLGGESMDDANKRVIEAFENLLGSLQQSNTINNEKKIAIVAHGGTIMAIMQHLFGGDFYDYKVKNLEGYLVRFDDADTLFYSNISQPKMTPTSISGGNKSVSVGVQSPTEI